MINLLPPSIKESRKYGRRNISLFGYASSLLGTALLTAIIIIASLQFIGSEEPVLKQKLLDNETQLVIFENDIKSIETTVGRLETAQEIKNQSVKFSELIPKIGAVLPEGVILNALSLTGGATDPLELSVDLRDASLAPIMIRNLVESDLFEAADISSLSPKGIDTSEGSSTGQYTFTASVSASFTGTADALKKEKAAAAADAAKKKAADAEKAQQAQ